MKLSNDFQRKWTRKTHPPAPIHEAITEAKITVSREYNVNSIFRNLSPPNISQSEGQNKKKTREFMDTLFEMVHTQNTTIDHDIYQNRQNCALMNNKQSCFICQTSKCWKLSAWKLLAILDCICHFSRFGCTFHGIFDQLCSDRPGRKELCEAKEVLFLMSHLFSFEVDVCAMYDQPLLSPYSNRTDLSQLSHNCLSVFLWFCIYLFCLTAFSAFANLLPALLLPTRCDALVGFYCTLCSLFLSFTQMKKPQCTWAYECKRERVYASKNWIDGNQLLVRFCAHGSLCVCYWCNFSCKFTAKINKWNQT